MVKPSLKQIFIVGAAALLAACAPTTQSSAEASVKAPMGGPLQVEATRSSSVTCRQLARRYAEAAAKVQPTNVNGSRWTPLRVSGFKEATAEALLTSRDRRSRDKLPIYTEVACVQNGGTAELSLSSKGPISPEFLRRINENFFRELRVY